jgi:hypothetical protein
MARSANKRSADPWSTTRTPTPPATPEPPSVTLLADSKLVETYWLPAHNQRRESPLFVRNKHFLRDEVQLPC